MKKINLWLFSSLLLAFGSCWAFGENTAHEKIKQDVQSAFPELTVDSIEKSPINGLYQLSAGSLVLYTSEDGHYLIAGDMLDLRQTDKDKRNMTEELRRHARADVLKTVKLSDMVIYKPKVLKGVVTILTDPSCGYCRKLHDNVPELLEQGIEIRYLAFPREGIGSESYNKMTSVWCAKNREQAMTDVMNGKEIELKTCAIHLENQFDIGQKLGVNGTPTLIFPDGTLVGGYIPVDRLVKEAIKHNVVK